MRPLYLYYRPANTGLSFMTATQNAQDAWRRLKNQLATADSGARGGEGFVAQAFRCHDVHTEWLLPQALLRPCDRGTVQGLSVALHALSDQDSDDDLLGRLGTLCPGVLLNRSHGGGSRRQPGPESASRPQRPPSYMHIILHYDSWLYKVLHYTRCNASMTRFLHLWFYTTLHDVMWYCIVLYCIVLYCIVLYCIVLYCSRLYMLMFCYVMLYYVIVYEAISYCSTQC